jgi:hypothetical protein
MKNSLYALVAVLVGVMLVGLLPGQLSNLATSAVDLTTLQGSKAPGNSNVTVEGSGFTPSRSNSSSGNETVTSLGETTTAASTANATAGPKSDGSEGPVLNVVEAYNPSADLAYYGMMSVGLVMALGVYLISRRMLG